MAKIQKKSAMIGVFIIAAVLAVWKFAWEPYAQRIEENMAATPTVEVIPSAVPVTTGASASAAPSPAVATAPNTRSVKTVYGNPAGEDPVGFNIRVDDNGIITEVKVDILAENSTSKNRQESFATGLPQVIIGKKLSELTAIDKVGGSSLTTNAFNASLEKLKSGV